MAQILLVDDDTNVLLTLAIALRRQSHTVTVAQNGWQALNLLRRHTYDFLISDVSMPGMNGVELARRAHTMPNVPIVILTSALEIELQEGLVEHFLPKPVDVRELNDVLAHDLANHGLRESNSSQLNNPQANNPSLGAPIDSSQVKIS